ncbi:MAG: hypothetical protein CL431_04280 [Acidimicrobiaceae bacterium]|jgi:hypothetical protein|nr:hypothetical protein [Acidimicrobiaceae bacterium]|tara:strand:+ start:51369 stop:52187 length:819 start_codon:yes stop_codon:yes gene_type:complete
MASPKYGKIDFDYALQLATTTADEDGPIWMVNLMKYHDVAQYEDRSRAKITGQEADDLYSPLEPLKAIGAEPVYFGEVENKLLGDYRDWDRVAVVKYPTRKSFIEMQERKDFQDKHVHKEAGMEETIIMGCLPMNFPNPQSPLPDWGKVQHPPTSEDGPIIALHVVKFNDRAELGETPEQMAEYTSKAATVGIDQGVRISGWFGVEGTIVGDGREWDQVRFNAFPSKAAFMAVVQDPARLEAQRTHREHAILDTYTLIVRTTFDQIKDSIEQ